MKRKSTFEAGFTFWIAGLRSYISEALGEGEKR